MDRNADKGLSKISELHKVKPSPTHIAQFFVFQSNDPFGSGPHELHSSKKRIIDRTNALILCDFSP